MKYALIKNGIVENIIAASPAFVATLTGFDHIEALDTPEELRTADIGWLYDTATGLFSAPEVEPVTNNRHISVGAFYDRFGVAKYAILADTNPMVQALIKDTSVRAYIDLDRPDLLMGLQMLVNAGHAIDPVLIINGVIQPNELV